MRNRNLIVSAGVGVGAALGMPVAAHADVDFVEVTSTADPGDGNCLTNGCTLREAIGLTDDTDPITDVDQITFNSALTGTITLNGTQLPTVDEPLTIQGPGAGILAVSGNDLSRILYVNTLAGADVTVADLTLRNGRTTANAPFSAAGGAIGSHTADLTIEDAVITGSAAIATGTGYATGGGVSSDGGPLTIRNSTISGNSATAYATAGGGVATGFGSALTIENSTISGNTANGEGTPGSTAYGGGLHTGYMDANMITRSTISGNSAGNAVNSFGLGGGISGRNGPLTIQDSTISGNAAGPSGLGGGVRNFTLPADPDPVIANTVVANNSAPNSPELAASGTAMPPPRFQVSFSLIENTSGAAITETVADSNLTGVDPQLAALAANGGPTETHRPAPGSPVLDKGLSAGPTDQRGSGFIRPVDVAFVPNSAAPSGNGADIGSVELQELDVAGQIEIEKQTVPNGDPTLFSFTATDLPNVGDQAFSLSDNGVRTAGDVPPGPYDVSEDAATGFDLTGLACNDGGSTTPSTTAGRTATVNLDPGETVRCVFTNTRQTSPVTPPGAIPGPAFNLKAAIRKCKKKFPKGPKRKKCIKKAKAKAKALPSSDR